MLHSHVRAIALALAASIASVSCTPLAVGAVVVGGTTTVVGARAAAKDCDGEGCVYEQAMGIVAVLVGLLVTGAGAVYLVRD